MEKYIVEAPEIKTGQILSSGGIRENGKMVCQYKNPIPFTDTFSNNNIETNMSYTGSINKSLIIQAVAAPLIETVILGVGVPLIHYGINKIGEKIAKNRLESRKLSEIHIPCEEIDYSDEKMLVEKHNKNANLDSIESKLTLY